MIKSFARRIRKDRRGSTFVLAAFVAVGFTGFAGVTVDFAYLYRTQRLLQAATDAASLAGAQKLASSTSAATTAANDFLTYNPPPAGATGTPSVTLVNCTSTHGSSCTADPTTPNGIEVTEINVCLDAGFDTCDCSCDLSRHECLTAPR